jgi:hypothetical protein
MDLSQHLDNGVISFQEAVELASQTGWGELDFFSNAGAPGKLLRTLMTGSQWCTRAAAAK